MEQIEKRGQGRHVITIHEWDAHIFTWECTCWSGIPGDSRGFGNAPYGWAQCEEQVEEHLSEHGQGKARRIAEFTKAIKEATRPLTKKERKEKREWEMGR
jgi:hypothetical protein